MSLKDNIVRGGHPHPYKWICTKKELLNFHLWAELFDKDIIWADFLITDRILKEPFPLSSEERKYLLEYLSMMEE